MNSVSERRLVKKTVKLEGENPLFSGKLIETLEDQNTCITSSLRQGLWKPGLPIFGSCVI